MSYYDRLYQGALDSGPAIASGMYKAKGVYDRANEIGDVAERVSSSLGERGGRGFWGNVGTLARGVGTGVGKLAGGVMAGGQVGSLSGNPIGTVGGAAIGGLASLPSAIGSVWDAIQEVRGKRNTGGGVSGYGFSDRRSVVDTPRDIQRLDSELLHDYNRRNNWSTDVVPSMRSTPGYVPEEAMNLAGAYDRVPQQLSRGSSYYPTSLQYQSHGMGGGSSFRGAVDSTRGGGASRVYRYARSAYQ